MYTLLNRRRTRCNSQLCVNISDVDRVR